jgi:hypothetical protein
VSDGIIAPGYTPEALEILRQKKGGKYNVIQIDPSYVCGPVEQKDVFGVTFEQGHNFFRIDRELLGNVVTANKDLPESALRDMIVSLITLKYTQSNSVCYVKGGQAIGVGAGQQSRVHCTRLAGNKADTWWLRHHPKVLGLKFVDGIRRANRDNAIDVYISDEHDDVLADGEWQKWFAERPEVAHARGEGGVGREADRRDAGQRRLLPVRRQHRAGPQVGRHLRGRARRLHPRRQRDRDGRQVRHGHVLHRDASVPPLRHALLPATCRQEAKRVTQ